MSEPRCITPLLEGLIMGEAISDHHGVRCCPAMKQDPEEKYIVKILSIPASQVQLEALLLTGAYSDRESALAYFKELAEDVAEEAELLQRLSRLEGFVSYEGWQVEPQEDGTGYEVYLLGAYRPTLARYLARTPMTHLGAVNLGLDLCAALSVSRQSGYLYAALKPGNVYIAENGEFRIGDLGFIPLESLKYASLPDKYRSDYTPPEIEDAYSALNSTIDIYAAGLILYQAYNNGQLPAQNANEPMAPPAYADYEMAEIILKACAQDPGQRFQTPVEMGQALVGYMQRNSIDDTLIIPTPVTEEPEAAAEPEKDESTEAAASETGSVAELADGEEINDAASGQESAEAGPDPLGSSLSDETAPNEEVAKELEHAPVSEEVDQMLAQADELIAHETPDPVIPPDPIDVPIPPRIVPEAEEQDPAEEPGEEPPAEDSGEETETAEEAASDPAVPPNDDTLAEDASSNEPPKYKGLISVLTTILILLILAVGALLFYENYYIQSIDDISLVGDEDYLTVMLDTDVDNALLTVSCTDTYGNTKHASVENNTAYFTELNPDTQYKVSVDISGFHQLIGTTTDSYTTAPRTEITSFAAVTGAEDGSVILSFTVQGQANNAWRVVYQADGEEERSLEFTGNTVSVTGLTVGSKYAFHLEPVSDLYVIGSDTLEHTASKLVYAEGLTILGFDSGILSAGWNAPEGQTVESWTVRCYNDAGYDNTVTVTDTQVSISDLDPTAAYTVDVKAAGMSLGTQAHISANSVTVKQLNVDDSTAGQLTVSWTYSGTAPTEGWLLLYTVGGSNSQVIRSDTESAVISPLVPGADYTFTLQTAAGNTVFCEPVTQKAPGGEQFSGYNVTAADITFRMCRTPSKASWTYKDIKDADYTSEFSVGEKASLLVKLGKKYKTSKDQITTLFVICDSAGNPISIESHTRTWTSMWNNSYCSMNIPVMPDAAGSYTLSIYFNDSFVTSLSFTVK